jgi:hypothetical protein
MLDTTPISTEIDRAVAARRGGAPVARADAHEVRGRPAGCHGAGGAAGGEEALMSDTEGTLRMQPSGRWAIIRSGHKPYEITSGDVFRVEVDGELKVTRMEWAHGKQGRYYSVDGYELHSGMRAAIGAED